MAYLDWFSPQYEKGLGPLGQEPCEFMDQNVLNLVCLLDSYADSHTIDAWLYENLLILVSRDCQRVEQDFWRAGSFYFWHIVSFRGLRGKIREGEGGCEGRPNTLEVRTQRL